MSLLNYRRLSLMMKLTESKFSGLVTGMVIILFLFYIQLITAELYENIFL